MNAIRKLAILGFHKIGTPPSGGWPSWFYVPEETFVEQLRYLGENGWQVIDLVRFLQGLEEPESLPERGALITFDDGYRSIRQLALPHLRGFGYPAIVFMPTNFIAGSNDFDRGVEPEEAMCDWEDLRELDRHGVSVQSHGASHRAFSRLSETEQEQEAVASKTALEAGLGKPVEVLAFPYGDGGANPERVRRLLSQAGYRAACLYRGGPNPVPVTDPFRLTRLAMGPDTDLSAALGGRP